MKLSRRNFVKSAGATALAAGTAAPALAGPAPGLIIYDSRVPESVVFASRRAGARLDLAGQHGTRWRDLRAALPAGPIVGLTGWSDFVLVRGFAGEQRRRVRSLRKVGALHAWELA
jgi:hypothetical protein